MTRSRVAVVRSTYDNVKEKIAEAIELAGGLHIESKKKILIKINLCDFRPPETGAITHPLFLDAFLSYLRSKYPNNEIFVIESDATAAQPDLLIKWFGFLPILEKWNAKYMNLSREEKVVVEIRGRHFKKMEIPKVFLDAYFISLPKMKTHTLTKITCCLKNQFGCIPVTRKIKFHRWLDDVIVDANLAMRPNFCLVDGIISMVGTQGPAFGIPTRSNLIVAGSDPVAVDSCCARIMGFNPYLIGHIRKSATSGVGSIRSQMVGMNLKECRIESEFSPIELIIMKIAEKLSKT